MPRTAPSPTAAPAVYEQSNASGTVYDDQGRPLDGVTIRAEQVSGPAGFVQSTLTSQGRFRLVAVPVGTLIRLLATKTGYGERSLTVLVKAGCDGGPGCNVFDFGVPAGRIDESSFSNALSRGLKVLALEKPETGYFQPWIRLRFDRPVDRAGFEQALQVRGPKPECWQAAGGVSDDALVTVLDAAALNFSWDADSRAVSVQLKDGLHLPPLDAAAHGCSRTGYRLSLHDADGQALFNDRQGQPAARYLYHLADQESDLRDFFFDPQQTGPLQLQQVQARDLAAGDELLLRFNKPLHYRLPGWGDLAPASNSARAAGSDGPSARATAANYDCEISRAGTPGFSGQLSELGWEARYVPDQPESVRLSPSASARRSLFSYGDLIRLRASRVIQDPTNMIPGADPGWITAELIQP